MSLDIRIDDEFRALITPSGGLDVIGKLRHNKKHGAASFYAIPVIRLKSAFVRTYAYSPPMY